MANTLSPSRLAHNTRKGRSSSQLCRPTTRVKIYARDGWCCVWCQRRGQKLSLDHYIPRSSGGSNLHTNLLTSCVRCNSRRKNRPALLWAQELATFFESVEQILDRAESSLARDLPKFLP